MLTPLRGMGGMGGCKASLCAIGSVDPAEQAADAEAYAEKFRAMDDVEAVVTTFSADTPQLFFSVDRDKAQALGVSVSSVFSTLQSKLASFYVNDFNIEGCSRQVIVQNEYDGRDADMVSACADVIRKKCAVENGRLTRESCAMLARRGYTGEIMRLALEKLLSEDGDPEG